MVMVRFLRTEGREVHRAGPFPWVRLGGGSLEVGPDGKVIARYRGGIWAVDGHSVPKYIIHGSTCTVRFEADSPNDSATHGPFDKVELVDGSAYVEPGRRLLARLDEHDQQWYSYEDKRRWPKMVVEKAS
jgi:hypothetical protein